MRNKHWVLAVPILLTSGWMLSAAWAGHEEVNPLQDVPKEVRALEGTYTGSWTMYGINDKGEVVKRAAWTDTMRATGAAIKGNQALVTTVDEMTFEGGRIPPRKYSGTEGYYLKADGALGDYFIESQGQTQRMVRVSDTVWSYAYTASAQELAQLGCPKGATGQQVLVKVVTNEGGAETHRISRLTTVSWKDKDGKDQALQFISLAGYHKHQK